MHQRPPSLYENIFILGSSSFPVLLNILQSCSVSFVCWTIVLLSYYSLSIYKSLSFYFLCLVIIGFVFYLILQTYLIVIGIKWITVLGSIEMKRNERWVKKLISHQFKYAGKISEEIFVQFKILLYNQFKSNPNVNNNDNEELSSYRNNNKNTINFDLNYYPCLKELIKTSYKRYKRNVCDSIKIGTELKPLLASCGSCFEWNDINITLIISLLGETKRSKGEIDLNDLYDICGALLYFKTLKPHQIIKTVFETYYDNYPKIYKETKSLKWSNIELFFNHNLRFFNDEMLLYLKEQCSYIRETFSLDDFISTIVTPRYYYPN